MTTAKLTTTTAAAIACCAVAAPTAMAHRRGDDHGTKRPAKPRVLAAIKDCAADGDLDAVYTPGHLKQALRRMPSDLGAYTFCPDVLRFARTAGPVVPVRHGQARLRARCTGAAYDVTLSVGATTLGTATVPACRSGRTKIVRVPVTATAKAPRHKHRRQLVTVVAKPGGSTIQFVAYLTGRRVAV